MMPREFLRVQFSGENDEGDEATLSVKGKSYSLLRAGENARWPEAAGYATVLSDSGNRRKPIKSCSVPLGNLLHELADGMWREPMFAIVIHRDDWQKLKDILHEKGRRVIEGGAS